MTKACRKTSGIITDMNPSEDKLWTLFNFVFSPLSKKSSTYKFGLIKAMLDSLFTGEIDDGGLFISYGRIFERFAENYWNLVAHYHLKQQHPNKYQSTALENIINETIADRNLAENITYTSLSPEIQADVIKKLSKQCSTNVFGALYNDLGGCVFSFDLKGPGITIAPNAYEFMLKYKMTIEKLNYYAWAEFLEQVNKPKIIDCVLEKLESAIPKRKNLSEYRKILYEEFEQDTCFYCGRKLNRHTDVDHFVPWSFVKSDKLWNLVLACPECNNHKRDKLPEQKYVNKILTRNSLIPQVSSSPIVEADMKSYNAELIPKMMTYAEMSGFQYLHV